MVCRFDVSSIPVGSTVSSATLQLYVNRRELNAVTNAVNLYNVTKAWTESAVTQGNTGESIGSLQDSQAFPAGPGWITFNVPVALVQSWINTPATNFGVQLRSSGETHISPYPLKENYLRFDSAQSLMVTNRPKLTINYTPNGNIKPNVCLTMDPKLVIRPSAQPTITADASDPDGTIASVQLYIDGVLKGTDMNAPYAFSGYRMSLGEHNVHAVATDNAGGTKTSVTNRLLCAQTVYSENMDVAPAGWTLEGQWEHGTPSGLDGATLDDFGEPEAGYSGTKILGYQLDSPYYIGAYTTNYATTVAINCTGYTNVALRFHTWLGIWTSGYDDHADIHVSTNGSTWSVVWASSNPDPNGCWTERRYNIPVANNQQTVYVRWKMQGGQYANQYAHVGWNLDDVYVYGQAATVPLAVTFNANGGSAPSFATNDVYFGMTYDALPDSSRAGYSLSGWYTEAAGGIQVTSTTRVSVAVAHTLYARWNLPPSANAGADQMVAAVPASLWTPAEMQTAAWYDAADTGSVILVGGKVSEWLDKSGNSRHVVQTNALYRPTYAASTVGFVTNLLINNKPFMFTNGLVDIYLVGAIDGSALDKRLISEVSSTSATNLYMPIQSCSTAGRSSYMSGFIRNNANTLLLSNTNMVSASNAFDFAATKLYQVRDTGSSLAGRVNGETSYAASYTRTGTFAFDTFGIGGIAPRPLAPTGAAWMKANVKEIVIVSSLLGDADRQKLEGYLAHKWAITNSLPIGHPYKSMPPTGPVATAMLNGSASDPEGDPVTLLWSGDSGPAPVMFSNAAATNATVTFMTNGVYTLRLTASDAFGSSSDLCNITVTNLTSFQAWLLDNSFEVGTGEGTLAANGVNTLGEVFIAGLNPTNPASRFEIQDLEWQALDPVLQWSGVSGRLYSVYWSSNLLGSFQLVQSNIPWNMNNYTDTVERASPNNFYRIGVQLAE